MFGLGLSEIALILVVALIVFGPDKLPEVAKTLGRTVGTFRRTLDDLKHDFTLASLEHESSRPAQTQTPTPPREKQTTDPQS